MLSKVHPCHQGEIHRAAPVNLKNDDVHLFKHEIDKSFNLSRYYSIKGAFIESNGLVWDNLSVEPRSLRHIKRKALGKLARVKKGLKLAFRRLFTRHNIHRVENGLWIADTWSRGYFHWFGDALPILEALNGTVASSVLILPSDMKGIEFINESISLYGLDILYLDPEKYCYCENLIFSDLLAPSGNFIPQIMKSLRSRMVAHLDLNRESKKRIFISRKFAERRNLLNEKEIIEVLNAFGFETVYAENMDWAEQVECFAEADTILALHGAGLMNMLFMPEHAKVIEIRADDDRHNNCYFSLADALNHGYFYLKANAVKSDNDHIGNMELSPSELKALLSEYFN